MSHTLKNWQPMWTLYRFRDEDGKVAAFTKAGNDAKVASRVFADRLIKVSEAEGNLLLNGGITILWKNVATTGVKFNAANSRLGVGTDGTAANAIQTQLNPSVPGNVWFEFLDATYPQISNQTVVYQATYGPAIANFLWQEFGLDNDAPDGQGAVITSYAVGSVGLLNRLVNSQGAKTLGQTWTLSLSIQLS